jgi:small subunit ribosomal protein S17
MEELNKNSENTATPKAVKSNKRILQGKVESNRANKTIVVSISSQVAHPIYKKYYKKTKTVLAHDETNDCKIGDKVKVRECRPLSALKRWELVEIVERAK